MADTGDSITHHLSQGAFSTFFDNLGIHRADGARLESNSPCEDRLSRAQLFTTWGTCTWTAAAVFDGHSGWQAADYLENHLVKTVQAFLEDLNDDTRDSDAIQKAITEAFVHVDRAMISDFVESAHDEQIDLATKMQNMQIAFPGSCALLSLFNSLNQTLYTACTGDSRAVLVQQGEDNIWICKALSEDQKGNNDSEIARIQNEHPGEDWVTQNGKVLGMSVSRAFGDLGYKTSYDTHLDISKRFFTNGPRQRHEIPTPPYLTAEPVMMAAKIEQPSFLILATDGLWDECSNQEAADLVVRWLEAQPDATNQMRLTPPSVWWKSQYQTQPEYTPGFDFLQRWQGFDTRFWQERTTIVDLDNAAVHLVRNACGGNHQELLAAKLTARPPFSREIRDDITVQVIFFDICGLARS